MKIAILGPYPLDQERLSGVEVAIVYVQRELLKRQDTELHIVTCKERLDQPRTAQADRLTITYLPREGLGRLTWHRREVKAMVQALDGISPDVVHAHTSGLYAGAALACRYPSVLTVHGIASQEAKLVESWPGRARGWVDTLYERWAVRRTKHLMSITPYVDQVFHGVFAGQSYLVENACDECFFQIERQPVAGRIFFAGPVIPRKGILPLLKALKLVRAQMPEAHVQIAGSVASRPEYYAACLAYVEEHGLGDAVTFMGHLSQDKVVEAYATCSVFVLPSFQETAPMTIEQAMAAAVPSVATRAGGVPWMLKDGLTGWTVPVPATLDGDPPVLAEALLKVLMEPREALQMGSRAKAVAEERFHPRAVAQRTYRVYQDVIAAERGNGQLTRQAR